MAADLVTRRTALKYVALITVAAQGWRAFPAKGASLKVLGYGRDPNLLKRPVTWPRTLTSAQLATLAALCDVVLPAEPPHPSAGAIRVHEFLDEWISAPYPQMQADRIVILTGLKTLNDATRSETEVPFTQADLSQQTAVFDRLCNTPTALEFSRRLIELICSGYYTTREGHAAIGYVGNVALTSFSGPPSEIRRHLDDALDELLRTPLRKLGKL